MARRVARTDSATAPRGIVTTLIEPREVLMTKSKTLESLVDLDGIWLYWGMRGVKLKRFSGRSRRVHSDLTPLVFGQT